MPRLELDSAATAICGNVTARRDFAGYIAARSQLHLRRVALSEMFIEAAEREGSPSEGWNHARNCMPYLMAATKAEEMRSALRIIEGLREKDELEDFFLKQVSVLDMRVGSLDREKFVEPATQAVEEWILGLLENAAELRAKALTTPVVGEENVLADYAISTWVWLGRLFAQTLPTFWQGRNRWLGNAASADAFTVQTHVISFNPKVRPTLWERWFGAQDVQEPTDDLARILAKSQDDTRKQCASRSIQDLDKLLVSTASLCSTLSLPNWEKFLPKEGGGNFASGGVPHDCLDELVNVLRRTQADGGLPYETGDEWVELVVAAAHAAKEAQAHLVEGDDSMNGSYRWPPIKE